MKKIKNIILPLITVLLVFVVDAQVLPPPIPPPPPPGLPIDEGILFLVISGLFFGVKKLKKNH